MILKSGGIYVIIINKVVDWRNTSMVYKNVKACEELIVCARVSNTHGYRGTVKVMPLCDYPEIIEELGYLITNDGVERRIISLSYHKDLLLVTLEGIDSMEKAEIFKMTDLYARREDIPMEDGAFFIEDLIGLEVFDADSGKKYGVIKSVDNFGASDIYTVKTPTGEFMIPVVKEYVPEIDLEKGIFIRPIEGMTDEN